MIGPERGTHESSEEPDVRLGELVARNELLPAVQNFLELVEALEERYDVALVRLLSRREPALVHAVVDRVVDPVGLRIDLGASGLGVEVDGGELLGEEGVEGGVEEADDLGRLVVDDRLSLLVPDDGDGCKRRVRKVNLE